MAFSLAARLFSFFFDFFSPSPFSFLFFFFLRETLNLVGESCDGGGGGGGHGRRLVGSSCGVTEINIGSCTGAPRWLPVKAKSGRGGREVRRSGCKLCQRVLKLALVRPWTGERECVCRSVSLPVRKLDHPPSRTPRKETILLMVSMGGAGGDNAAYPHTNLCV